MKKLSIILMLLAGQLTVFGQWAITKQMRAENTLDRLSDKGGLSNSDQLYGIPWEPGGVIGDTYLNKNWNKSTILLYQSETMIEGYPVKYDIKTNLVEIKSPSGIKILDVRKIKNLVWIDSLTSFTHYFVNGNEYKSEGTPVTGLLEVMADGQIPLLKKTGIYVKQPTYNAALDVGSKDVKIYQKEEIFYSKDGQLKRVKNKKDVLAAAGDRFKEVESFIKQNSINVNKETELIKVFDFLNAE